MLNCYRDSKGVLDWLHERMPAILTNAEAVQRWLDPDVVGDDAIGSIGARAFLGGGDQVFLCRADEQFETDLVDVGRPVLDLIDGFGDAVEFEGEMRAVRRNLSLGRDGGIVGDGGGEKNGVEGLGR